MDKKLIMTPDKEYVKWKGYNIDQLRYRRVYTQVKLEIEKAELLNSVQSLTSHGSLIPAKGTSGKILSKVLGALNYFDYAYLAYRLGNKFFKISKKIKRSRHD